MLENVLEVTELCRHSLMCRHVCPVGNLTHLETLTPHGWAQLVALERRGLSTWNAATIDALYKCADCGSCRSHCVSGNPLPDAIAAARGQLVERGLAPSVVYEVAELLAKWENPYVGQSPQRATGRGSAALFVGDEAHFLRPALVSAAVALLRTAGVEPILIGQGRNNGFLANSLGLQSRSTELARANLGELEASGATRLFVLSPGDFYVFSQLYPERLGLTLPRGVEVLEVVPFLAAQREAGRLGLRPVRFSTPVAYVEPTHSVRVKGRGLAPRALLQAVLGEPVRELFWRGERAYPCGDLALQFTQPQLADALTQSRLLDAANAGAGVVVTEAPGSLAHLERHATDRGIEVHGLYELLAGQLTV